MTVATHLVSLRSNCPNDFGTFEGDLPQNEEVDRYVKIVEQVEKGR